MYMNIGTVFWSVNVMQFILPLSALKFFTRTTMVSVLVRFVVLAEDKTLLINVAVKRACFLVLNWTSSSKDTFWNLGYTHGYKLNGYILHLTLCFVAPGVSEVRHNTCPFCRFPSLKTCGIEWLGIPRSQRVSEQGDLKLNFLRWGSVGNIELFCSYFFLEFKTSELCELWTYAARKRLRTSLRRAFACCHSSKIKVRFLEPCRVLQCLPS